MKRRSFPLLAAAAVALVSAASAFAQPQNGSNPIRVKVVNLQVTPPTAACAAGGTSFGLVTIDGTPVGSATSCLTSEDSQCPAGPFLGCRDKLAGTVEFTLVNLGTLTVDATFKDFWVGATGFDSRAHGTITGGTGAFAGATGTAVGRGTIDFALPQPDVAWVIRVGGEADDSDL